MVTTGSLITKKIIAYSLKDLLKDTPYDKISIKHIMDHADYRRQTFYDHFTDKQDLLTWIYQQELQEVVEHFINYESWEQIFHRLLAHFEKQANFYQKTMNNDNVFSTVVTKQLNHFILYIIQDQTHPHQAQVKEDALFFAYGITHMTKDWLSTPKHANSETLATLFIRQLNQLKKRQEGTS